MREEGCQALPVSRVKVRGSCHMGEELFLIHMQGKNLESRKIVGGHKVKGSTREFGFGVWGSLPLVADLTYLCVLYLSTILSSTRALQRWLLFPLHLSTVARWELWEHLPPGAHQVSLQIPRRSWRGARHFLPPQQQLDLSLCSNVAADLVLWEQQLRWEVVSWLLVFMGISPKTFCKYQNPRMLWSYV